MTSISKIGYQKNEIVHKSESLLEIAEYLHGGVLGRRLPAACCFALRGGVANNADLGLVLALGRVLLAMLRLNRAIRWGRFQSLA